MQGTENFKIKEYLSVNSLEILYIFIETSDPVLYFCQQWSVFFKK